ncbi:MAG: prepilin-type N-terminal cleavage/methylation domain-containing protein [Proteobacteria bacterium]|nr:prepilin-type N-terminal cleavage/methylation domain-containing protein [Pseudomonadota bacterium]MCG2741177.1 prepilin-type N-terminal cleavage/methylation domain-containing protein [Syntrophaceae bacterium]
MKSIYKPTGNRGFTLLEVLIVIFLLVTAFVGVISTTGVIIKSNSLSRTMTTATTLAKGKMEQLKYTGYNSVPGDDTDSIYTRTWTVTADGSPAAGMKTIVVTVRWSWQSAWHEVVLKTIVAQ